MSKSPFNFDASFSQVDCPLGRWCASGHIASETFKRSGPDSIPEPTRFFLVEAGNILGVYCEPCLVIANHLARLKNKESKGM